MIKTGLGTTIGEGMAKTHQDGTKTTQSTSTWWEIVIRVGEKGILLVFAPPKVAIKAEKEVLGEKVIRVGGKMARRGQKGETKGKVGHPS